MSQRATVLDSFRISGRQGSAYQLQFDEGATADGSWVVHGDNRVKVIAWWNRGMRDRDCLLGQKMQPHAFVLLDAEPGPLPYKTEVLVE